MALSIPFRVCCIASLLLWLSVPSFATHNHAGEINYEFVSATTIRATIVTYTTMSSMAADRDSLPIHWGDGSADEVIARTNGTGQYLGNNIKMNTYTGIHTYTSIPAAPDNFYIISLTDPNRNTAIANIANSVNVEFYIEDTVWFQGQGLDHSPILLYPPVDFANVGDTFFHNPTTYDIEADSLTFEFVQPKEGLGNVVPGYYDPYLVPYVAGDTMTIDRHNGMITWSVPRLSDIYDIAILVREYRAGVLLGTTTRDMVIIVLGDTSRRAPLSGDFTDTTIAVGQTFDLACAAIDTYPSHVSTLTAYGGPFLLAPDSASFSSAQAHQPTGTMSWTPGPNIYKQRETYIITVRSEVSDSSRFTTLRSFRITVADPRNVGISELSVGVPSVRVYPDPAQDMLSVHSPSAISVLEIYSTDGRLVQRMADIDAGSFDMDVSSLSPGMYTLLLKDKNGTPATARFEIWR